MSPGAPIRNTWKQSELEMMRTAVLDERLLTTRYGTFNSRVYKDHEGSIGAALWMGDLSGSRPVLCRVHSSCFTSEALGALDCDCREQFDLALRSIASQQSGIIFYLLQEGRGAGLLTKALDRMVVQSSGGTIDTFEAYEQLGIEPDPRTYRLVPAICADMGIKSLHLMTNNPAKIEGLTAEGLQVEPIQHSATISPYNSQYLDAKAKTGHNMDFSSMETAVIPENLAAADPQIEQLGDFFRIASYDMPIGVGGQVVWFRATAYGDEAAEYERLILSRHSPAAPSSVLEIFRDSLFERLTGGSEQAKHYMATVQRILASGAGSILAIPDDPAWIAKAPAPSSDEDLQLLQAHDQALKSLRPRP